ncbi:oocyte zinc finger protein XlCOF19-like isoform X2 [Pomacea canaliculata]|uniref:oocyte zinc finger protein XlCOF19-like isoform X2 n=1 Tax=Pomacea canaliculata TaxID=400727 RepID=UPI000D730EA0|nr:oocyte zinc finger protein XlCOF19-like isoform X2 [Pomacea canaliculata]
MSSILFYKKLGVKTRQRQSKSTKAAETRCLESSSKSPVSSSSSSSSSSNIVEHSADAFDDRSHSKDCRQEDSQREEVETRNLSCPTCHKCYPFSSQVTFNRHVRRHSQHVQCEVCGKWLASLDSLGQHQRGLHGNIKPYICNECGQTFSFRHSYNVHMHKHTGVRPYKCSQCSKTYLTASHLKTHVISQHSGRGQEPQFQCETCGRSFLWASNLKTHQLIHTDVRPFQCSICSKGFTTKQALRLHNQSYHENERKFECDVCHKFYKSERLRNIHKRRHSSLCLNRALRHTSTLTVKRGRTSAKSAERALSW